MNDNDATMRNMKHKIFYFYQIAENLNGAELAHAERKPLKQLTALPKAIRNPLSLSDVHTCQELINCFGGRGMLATQFTVSEWLQGI